MFDGAGLFVRPKGVKNSNDLAFDQTWGGFLNCLDGGGGIGADCNGYPENGVRFRQPDLVGLQRVERLL